jgi:hypothetical protein
MLAGATSRQIGKLREFPDVLTISLVGMIVGNFSSEMIDRPHINRLLVRLGKIFDLNFIVL